MLDDFLIFLNNRLKWGKPKGIHASAFWRIYGLNNRRLSVFLDEAISEHNLVLVHLTPLGRVPKLV